MASAHGYASVTYCHNVVPPASLSMPHHDALLLWALTGRLVGLLTPLAQASSTALTVVAAALAAALVGAYVVLAILLLVAVLRVVRPRSPDQRSPIGGARE